ncbi:MAG: type VI secretion system tip protein VgrG [Myxococcales bacterium]|nr:type VI secretion system tip protein VgrG [Myxococcales bacterium]
MQDGNVRIRLISNALPGSVEVDELHGHEAIGQLFDISVRFAEPEGAEVDLERLVDPRARAGVLFVRGEELLRVIWGRFVEARKSLDADKNYADIRARFVPRAWSTSIHERTEAYVGSAPQIIARVMKRSLLTADGDYELRLTGDYPEREFVLQYHETDLRFLSRLCEHWGIYFFFEHGKRDRWVFCDDNQGILDVGVSPEEPPGEGAGEDTETTPANPGADQTTTRFVPFQEDPTGQRLGVQQFASNQRALPSAFGTHDYNYRTPTVNLQASAPVSGSGDGLIIEYGLHFKTPEEGQFLASRRAEALLATQLTYDGSGNLPAFRAGGTIRMEEHPEKDFDLLVTRVEHRVGDAGYSNHFRAQPKDVTYRAPLVTPRPRVAGVVTGIIVGTTPTDPMIDDEGRYEVSLLFDAVDPGETRASRPIRMMQPHTGPDYGMHFPLKPGTEVAIGFINGDPDRPLIVGSIPNPITPSPVRGERQNTSRNILKSMSGVLLEMDDDA